METSAAKTIFTASLDRCSAHEDFVETFYDRLFASSEEVRAKFHTEEFDEHARARLFTMVLKSLKMAGAAAEGDFASLRHLTLAAESHNRYNHNVEPQHYSLWMRAFIATARGFDPEWDELTEEAWVTVLGQVIRHMLKSY